MPFLPPNQQRQSTEGTCCFYNWQHFGWHSALHGPSAVAELLVNLVNSIMGRSIVAYFLTAVSQLLIILPSVLRHFWLDVRKNSCPVKNLSGSGISSDEVLVWLPVWSEVQIVCIWSSRCHCHPQTPSSLALFKSRLVLPFWYRLT